MGGYFHISISNQVSSQSAKYIQTDIVNNSFGFRTVFDSSDLQSWKECVEN